MYRNSYCSSKVDFFSLVFLVPHNIGRLSSFSKKREFQYLTQMGEGRGIVQYFVLTKRKTEINALMSNSTFILFFFNLHSRFSFLSSRSFMCLICKEIIRE